MNDGFARLGDVVFNAIAPSGTAGSPGLDTGGSGTIEIGSAGDANRYAITVDAGRTITANASASLNGTLVNSGNIAVNGGTSAHVGSFTNNGVITVAGGRLIQSGDLVDDGTIAIANDTLEQDGNLSGGRTLTGFQTGDSLVLGVPVTAAT